MANSSFRSAISVVARSRSTCRRVVRRRLVADEPHARVKAAKASEMACSTLHRAVFVHPRGRGNVSGAAMVSSRKFDRVALPDQTVTHLVRATCSRSKAPGTTPESRVTSSAPRMMAAARILMARLYRNRAPCLPRDYLPKRGSGRICSVAVETVSPTRSVSR